MKKRRRIGERVLSQPSILLYLFKCILAEFIFLSVFLSFSLFFPPLVFASNHSSGVVQHPTQLFPKESRYQSYIEVGGIQYFNQESKAAGMYDLFLPLSSSFSNQAGTLFFSDLRIFDRSGSSFEGNAHVGYRVLLPETNGGKNQLFGVYASFDRRKSEKKNYFNQITIGGEVWHDKWFFGGNFYTPIGKKRRVVSSVLPSETQLISWKEKGRSLGKIIEHTGTITSTKTKHVFEKSLYGVDAEVGYAMTEQVTGYAGGYWFQDGFFTSQKAREAQTKWGPRLRVTYDYRPVHAKRAFGILDGMSLEAGIQHDKPRGTSGYIGFKVKAGLTHSQKTASNLSGFERHMTELVRRDPDIVLNETKTWETAQQFQITTEIEREKTRAELLEEFGLPLDATEKAIRKQYRNYAKKYHPDKNKGIGATEKYIYYTQLHDLIQEKRKPPTEKNTHYGFSPPSASQKNNRHSDSSFALVPFVPPVSLIPPTSSLPEPVHFSSSIMSVENCKNNISESRSKVMAFSHPVSLNGTSVSFPLPLKESDLIPVFHSVSRQSLSQSSSQIAPKVSFKGSLEILPQSFLCQAGNAVLRVGSWILMPFRWMDSGVNILFDMLIPVKGVNAQFNPGYMPEAREPLIYVQAGDQLIPAEEAYKYQVDTSQLMNLDGVVRAEQIQYHPVVFEYTVPPEGFRMDQPAIPQSFDFNYDFNYKNIPWTQDWMKDQFYKQYKKTVEEQAFLTGFQDTLDRAWKTIRESEALLSQRSQLVQGKIHQANVGIHNVDNKLRGRFRGFLFPSKGGREEFKSFKTGTWLDQKSEEEKKQTFAEYHPLSYLVMVWEDYVDWKLTTLNVFFKTKKEQDRLSVYRGKIEEEENAFQVRKTLLQSKSEGPFVFQSHPQESPHILSEEEFIDRALELAKTSTEAIERLDERIVGFDEGFASAERGALRQILYNVGGSLGALTGQFNQNLSELLTRGFLFSKETSAFFSWDWDRNWNKVLFDSVFDFSSLSVNALNELSNGLTSRINSLVEDYNICLVKGGLGCREDRGVPRPLGWSSNRLIEVRNRISVILAKEKEKIEQTITERMERSKERLIVEKADHTSIVDMVRDKFNWWEEWKGALKKKSEETRPMSALSLLLAQQQAQKKSENKKLPPLTSGIDLEQHFDAHFTQKWTAYWPQESWASKEVRWLEGLIGQEVLHGNFDQATLPLEARLRLEGVRGGRGEKFDVERVSRSIWNQIGILPEGGLQRKLSDWLDYAKQLIQIDINTEKKQVNERKATERKEALNAFQLMLSRWYFGKNDQYYFDSFPKEAVFEREALHTSFFEGEQRRGQTGELSLKTQISQTLAHTLHLEVNVDPNRVCENEFKKGFIKRWKATLPESPWSFSTKAPNLDDQESSPAHKQSIQNLLRDKAAEGDWSTAALAMEGLIRQNPQSGHFDTEQISQSIWGMRKSVFDREKWDNLIDRVKGGGGLPTGWFSYQNINRALFIDEISKSVVVGCPICTEQLIEGYIKATGAQPHYLDSIARIEAWGGTNVQYWDKIYPRVVAHWKQYQAEQKAGYSSIKSKIEEKAQKIFTQLKWEGDWETAKVTSEKIIRQDGYVNIEKIDQAVWSVLGREDQGIKEKLNRAIPEIFTQIKVDTLVNQVTEFVQGALTQYETSQAVIGGIASAQVGLQYNTQMKLYEGLFDLLNSRENRELLPSIEVPTGPIDTLKEAGKKASIGTGVMVACDSAVTRLGWLGGPEGKVVSIPAAKLLCPLVGMTCAKINWNIHFNQAEEEGGISKGIGKSTQASSPKEKPLQTHHFVAHKNKEYTPQFKEITDKYGLDLNGAWNKEKLPHQGRHVNEYHRFVLSRLERADRAASGNKEKFLELFEQYVKNPVRNNKDLMYRVGWPKN